SRVDLLAEAAGVLNVRVAELERLNRIDPLEVFTAFDGQVVDQGDLVASVKVAPVRADDLDHPDELRVDLDPIPGVPWDHVRLVALATREALEGVGLVGWPKTSGSRGI